MKDLITLTLTWTIPEHRADIFLWNLPSVSIGSMQVNVQAGSISTQGEAEESKVAEPRLPKEAEAAAPSPLDIGTRRIRPYNRISSPDAVKPSTGIEPGKFYTLKEVAEHMRCSTKTIYRLIQTRELTPCKFSRHYRFKGATVIAYLEQKIPRK